MANRGAAVQNRAMSALVLIGRQSSHYTRVVRMLALELDMAVDLEPIHDLPFRNPVDLSGWPRLVAFADAWRQRPSARATPYRFDPPPA